MKDVLQFIASILAALLVNILLFEDDPNKEVAGYGETVLFLITVLGAYRMIDYIRYALQDNNPKK